jgi:hypothetical protein
MVQRTNRDEAIGPAAGQLRFDRLSATIISWYPKLSWFPR